MIIRRLQASFGCLENETLELTGGLNVVELPNESGKSTWCAFILAMLYGVDTSQKDRADRLSDKNRYRPWGEARMSGSMDVESNGRTLHIERGTSGDAMRGFSAVYSDTWDPVEGATAENIGELLTGATKKIYENSAFIRQEGAAVTGEAELERRLQSLVSADDDTVAYIDARKKLKEWSGSLGNSRRGELPRLKEQADALRSELDSSLEAARRLMDARAALTQAEVRFKKAAIEVENHRLAERYKKDRALASARMEMQRAGNELKKRGGVAVDLNSVSALKKEILNVRALERSAREAEAQKNRVTATRVPRPETPPVFEGMDYEDAVEKAEKDTAAALELERTVFASGKRKAVCAALAFVLVTVLAAAGIFTAAGTWAFAAAGVAAAAGILFLLRVRSLEERAGTELECLKSLYGTPDFRLLAEQYSDRMRAYEEAAEFADGAVRRYEEAAHISDSARERLLLDAGNVLGGSGTMEELEEALNKAERAAEENRALQARYDAAKAAVDLLAGSGTDVSGKYELRDIPPLRGTPDAAAEEYAKAAEQREEALMTCYRLEGELSSGGDPDLIRARLERLEAASSEAEQELDAIVLATECLEKADSALRERFSPKLNRLAGEYFSELTGGRYDGLRISSGFSPSVMQAGEAVSRDKRSLSVGAAEQMYLAMRLAICSMLSQNSDPPPLILDDALCAFDDERMGMAMEVLRSVSAHRQVILFTCHSRERRYISSVGGGESNE